MFLELILLLNLILSVCMVFMIFKFRKNMHKNIEALLDEQSQLLEIFVFQSIELLVTIYLSDLNMIPHLDIYMLIYLIILLNIFPDIFIVLLNIS